MTCGLSGPLDSMQESGVVRSPRRGDRVDYFPKKDDPPHNGAEVLTATVVRAYGGTRVNLKVQNDGTSDFWATSVEVGTGPGFWAWPEARR